MHNVCGSNPRDVSMIIGRRNLNNVSANEIETSKPTDDTLYLSRGPTAGLRGAGRRSKARINHVDIQAEVNRTSAYPFPNLSYNEIDPVVVDVVCADDLKTDRVVVHNIFNPILVRIPAWMLVLDIRFSSAAMAKKVP